jgi:hypothetical protein
MGNTAMAPTNSSETVTENDNNISTLPQLIDEIALHYMLTQNSIELIRISDKEYYDNLIILTSNVIEKRFPFVPVTDSFNPLNSFSKEDAEFIAEIGYNTIRLGVLWAGFEPE